MTSFGTMRLSIIVVNWNSGPLLRRCLDAIAAARGPLTVEVTVVDNASRDTSTQDATASVQPFRILSVAANAGFARANNLALREARGDIVLLLNPDTELLQGSLPALVAFFQGHPEAGIVGGLLLHSNRTVQRSVRTFPTVLVLALLLTRVASVFPRIGPYRRYEMADFPYNHDERVDQVMGACFAIRRTVLDRLGPLDEGFWIWFEEVDYCRRARAAGFEVWFTPKVRLLHHQAVAFRQVSPVRRSWWFARSVVRYAWKHLGWGAAVFLTLLVPIHLLTAAAAEVLQPLPTALKRRSA